MRTATNRSLALVLLCAACGSTPPATTPPPSPSTPAPAAAASAPDAAPTPASTDDGFDAHVAAGGKAEDAKDWKTATAELDAAIAIRPDDARALTELTWNAVHAHQEAHAREVGARAVLAARKAGDVKLEAMALYNLGLAEMPVDNHAARSLWKASLDLRPNDTVAQDLGNANEVYDHTKDGDALLKQLGVELIEDNRKAPELPVDTAMLTALYAVGVDWDMGAGHGNIGQVIVCKLGKTDDADRCDYVSGDDQPRAVHARGAKAKAIIDAIAGYGVVARGGTLKVDIDCYDQDEGPAEGLVEADSCTVTAT